MRFNLFVHILSTTALADRLTILLCCACILFPGPTSAQQTQEELKRLSIEELMNIEVTSVSRTPEELSEVASAIQVITRQDILRSSATSVPEALRLAPNLQVTQLNTRHWIISARGFNAVFSNKLLVMIDGRTVYSPLFAGVFWDAQNVLLEDVERIEVISGPGGTLWGANAVNGVINIITRSVEDSEGLFVSASTGDFLKGMVEARYGGKVSPQLSYRIYARHTDRNNTYLPNTLANSDDWRMSQTGFAIDWEPSNTDNLTLQGDVYNGNETSALQPSSIDGQNIMGKWTHTFSENSTMIVQGYADRTWRRDVPGTINDELNTYDLDMQHQFLLGKRNHIIWGAGYRYMKDRTENNTQFVGFLPKDRNMHLFSTFVQDEISVVPELLKLIVGTKIQHNNFTGVEFQPSARLAFSLPKHQTLWAAVSRAVRTPSRIDVDYHLPAYPVPPPAPSVAGGPNFISEKVIAYELGYRAQPITKLSLSVAGFYNNYDDIYSVEALPGTLTYQIQNGAQGFSYGAEFAGTYMLSNKWRLRSGYTYLHKQLENKPGNVSPPATLTNLGSDAKHQAQLHSMLDLPRNFQLDILARYISDLPPTQYEPMVESYLSLDARIGWQLNNSFNASLNGQNLLDKRHAETGRIQIPQSIYGKLTFRY